VQQYQAQPQYQQQQLALQMPAGYAPAGVPAPNSLQQQQQYAALQQLQQAQAAGVPLNSLQVQQLQHLQQLQQAQQPLGAFPAPAAPEQQQQQYIQQQQQQQPPAYRPPQLTPEQQRLRALNQATEAQERKQEDLAFRYLDLDQVGEDILHFSELYMPTDNQVTVSKTPCRVQLFGCQLVASSGGGVVKYPCEAQVCWSCQSIMLILQEGTVVHCLERRNPCACDCCCVLALPHFW
jgi:hypothetical protein